MLVLLLTLVMISEPEQPAVEMTRAEEHQSARETKAQHVRAPQRSFLEKGLYEIRERRLIERFQAGVFEFHPLVGGMQSGAGFALGTSYSKGLVDAAAQVSFKGYQKYRVRFSAPPLFNGRVFAAVRAEYRNYSQETFYGVGNNSSRDHRSDYRLEDRTVSGELGLRVGKHVKVGGSLGFTRTDIGDGTGAAVPTLSAASFAGSLPAFGGTQPRYVKTGAFLDIDHRDEPGNPRRGGRYAAEWSSYHDANLGRYGFNRVDIEVQRYFPFFNDRRVIALRAKAALTHTGGGQQIPFYMLPSLGGSDNLRGFSEFRFRDQQMAVFNAEYRWEVFSGLDMALFADAGQVASRVSDFDLREMKTAGGIGFRFNTARKVFCRVDVGFSQEGPRVSLNFSQVF